MQPESTEGRSAATAQEIVRGWREGRPVLDSLAHEQMVVADAIDALSRLVQEADGYLSFFYYQGEMPNDREQLNDLISRLRSVNRVSA